MREKEKERRKSAERLNLLLLPPTNFFLANLPARHLIGIFDLTHEANCHIASLMYFGSLFSYPHKDSWLDYALCLPPQVNLFVHLQRGPITAARKRGSVYSFLPHTQNVKRVARVKMARYICHCLVHKLHNIHNCYFLPPPPLSVI